MFEFLEISHIIIGALGIILTWAFGNYAISHYKYIKYFIEVLNIIIQTLKDKRLTKEQAISILQTIINSYPKQCKNIKQIKILIQNIIQEIHQKKQQ